jgi:lipopolysaccharide transport system ATP-binding protein
MPDVVIKAEKLGKKYLICHQGRERYQTIREVLSRGIANAARRALKPGHPRPGARSGVEEFWALRDMCFDVKQGDRLGIIGRNGAGKSTLLKIVSRITTPTCGRILLKGRIASLLEVGTGFHPELTGRENIFLNGAVMGMARKEILRKFDDIVDFAEVERFLDTPVKRYSSGMYVRLAFAVAAHLEPEILIVDEVLAVGDSLFQKKCLGKMRAIGEEGRTVLFVSHNLGAIQQLTTRCLVLRDGMLEWDGDVSTAVRMYQVGSEGEEAPERSNISTNFDGFFVEKIAFEHTKVEPGFNKPVHFTISLILEKGYRDISLGFGIQNSLGARILTFEDRLPHLGRGRHIIELTLEDHHLAPGTYSLAVGIDCQGTQALYRENLFSFELGLSEVADSYLGAKNDRIGAFYRPSCRVRETGWE